jgi:hypothetical protein
MSNENRLESYAMRGEVLRRQVGLGAGDWAHRQREAPRRSMLLERRYERCRYRGYLFLLYFVFIHIYLRVVKFVHLCEVLRRQGGLGAGDWAHRPREAPRSLRRRRHGPGG